jgi:hypothetical protein
MPPGYKKAAAEIVRILTIIYDNEEIYKVNTEHKRFPTKCLQCKQLKTGLFVDVTTRREKTMWADQRIFHICEQCMISEGARLPKAK